ncbi:MAG: bis(5'-nucleosyl)-tetraphosphatase (symmetrical) YqeK [Clostridia bacterium]|nr:bis(5'-nucleosyl)-tetraphosphatase (symmetrical) YqeK [Clostridia bacterium]
MKNICITDSMVEKLRERVKPYLTEKRYAHTLGVEREAASLGRLFLPDDINKLRCAALLHDITKKQSAEEQLALCRELGIEPDDEVLAAPKLFHSITGAALAERDFPEYADASVISGIRWHTTGYAGMTMFESIIYLADYIEDTRTFEDCVTLRNFFYLGLCAAGSESEKYTVFLKTMVLSFDMTVKNLIEEASLIDRNTVEARNSFIMKLRETERKK